MLTTDTLTAADTYSTPIGHSSANQGDIAISVTGTFVGTLTLQRSLDKGVTWGDYATTYAVATEIGITPTEGAAYRIGFKAGAFTSGSAVIKAL